MNNLEAGYYHRIIFCIFVLFSLSFHEYAFSNEAEFQFYRNGVYDSAIPSPEEILGFKIGEKPARYAEAVQYLKNLSENFPRCKLIEFGNTFENRSLHYLIVSSEENMRRLNEIRSEIGQLGNSSRKSDKSSVSAIISKTPAIAWMMYGIHGDELSGPDAAIQLAYQLVAGEDSLTSRLRRELVICIHPMENPDGRERFLSQMQQWSGAVVNTDVQSIHHTGDWPWGRGNHYLFDLNRDWILLVNPESRARVRAIMEWNPQLIVDAHEMGALDTYLFSPAREPINPRISTNLLDWAHKFAVDQASALDQYGWSYYTREWLDEWYPGYGSSWPLLIGSVGILYEQAGTDGFSVKRHDGTILSYRESVHHQFVSSLVNLKTLAENRQKLLEDYYKNRKNALLGKSGQPAAFYIVPGENISRFNRFIQNLQYQNITVEISEQEFNVKDLYGYLQDNPLRKTLPKGTAIIRLDQPLRSLIEAILEFDPHMSSEFLREEREELLREKETRMYEVSSWSLPMAYGLESYWTASHPTVAVRQMDYIPKKSSPSNTGSAGYGYLCNYDDDAVVKALVNLLESEASVRVAKEPFTINGQKFNRGSLLLRNHENTDNLQNLIMSVSDKSGVSFFPVNTALAQQGPDLGGNQFVLLTNPRVALLAGPEIGITSFSSLWYLLDQELQMKHSILNSDRLGGIDFRKYNVLILPSAWSKKSYENLFGKEILAGLKTWIQEGGTLIAIGEAAAFIADTTTQLSATRTMRQTLKNRNFYRNWLEQKETLFKTYPDSIKIWNGGGIVSDSTQVKVVSKEQLKWLEKQDELARLFQPRGAILRAKTDGQHWMNFGTSPEIPVILYTSYAYLAMDPVQMPVTFSESKNLRLSGLLWPEARMRWAKTPYVTVERVGKGQIILFAGDPFFRAYFHGTARLLINSILLGPGFGTVRSVPW